VAFEEIGYVFPGGLSTASSTPAQLKITSLWDFLSFFTFQIYKLSLSSRTRQTFQQYKASKQGLSQGMSGIFALDMLSQAVHDVMSCVVRNPVIHKYQILCIYFLRYPTLSALSLLQHHLLTTFVSTFARFHNASFSLPPKPPGFAWLKLKGSSSAPRRLP
jgi:hypothetical protein